MERLFEHELTPALLDIMADLVGGSIIVASAPFGRILHVANPIGCARPKAEIIGVQAADYPVRFEIFTQAGEPARACDLPIARAIRTGRAVLNEVWLMGRPPTSIPVMCDAYPLTDPKGRVLGAVCASVDIRNWSARSRELRVTLKLRDVLARTAMGAALETA